MNEKVERIWDRLEADWERARSAVDEFLSTERPRDADWVRQLSELDRIAQEAGRRFADFARKVAVGRPPALMEVVFAGGPRDGETDWEIAGAAVIGVARAEGDEVVAAQGVYVAEGPDEARRIRFVWNVMTSRDASRLISGQ